MLLLPDHRERLCLLFRFVHVWCTLVVNERSVSLGSWGLVPLKNHP